jgi:hypothetical protein
MPDAMAATRVNIVPERPVPRHKSAGFLAYEITAPEAFLEAHEFKQKFKL